MGFRPANDINEFHTRLLTGILVVAYPHSFYDILSRALSAQYYYSHHLRGESPFAISIVCDSSIFIFTPTTRF